MIASTISADVYQPSIGDVSHKPRDLICVRFNNNFEFRVWIDNTISSSVVVNLNGIDEGLKVGEPELLTTRFEASR